MLPSPSGDSQTPLPQQYWSAGLPLVLAGQSCGATVAVFARFADTVASGAGRVGKTVDVVAVGLGVAVVVQTVVAGDAGLLE